MLQFTHVEIGREAHYQDVYLHFADVQAQVIATWNFAPMIGWSTASTVLAGFLDLLMLSIDDRDNALIRDLEFLVQLAGTRCALEKAAATAAAA